MAELIMINGKLRDLKSVCSEKGLRYSVCKSRFYHGDSTERILRPTNKKRKKTKGCMNKEVIERELRGEVQIKNNFKGVDKKLLKALLSCNCNELLRNG